MKKALKELIENAEEKRSGDFYAFIMIPNGAYDGFFGKNGYANILLLGQNIRDRKWYKIADKIDVISFTHPPTLNWEISLEYGVPCVWSYRTIHIEYNGYTSTIIACERGQDGTH